MFNVVLHEPEIPGNTENIGRTCVCTGTKLHLIDPLGFKLDKKNTRAGLDYWERVEYERYVNFVEFVYKNRLENSVRLDDEYLKKYEYIIDEWTGSQAHPYETKRTGSQAHPYETKRTGSQAHPYKSKANIYFLTTKGRKKYTDVKFCDGDFLMFGKESAGIPEEILSLNEDKCIRIPMLKEERSLNLANSVNIVLYEALRQNDFLNLEGRGELHRLKYV